MEYDSVSVINGMEESLVRPNVDSTSNFIITENVKKQTSTFLSMLVRCYSERSKYKSGGYRYSNALKLFSTYLFVVGGRITYETLAANLPLPSMSTIMRTISSSSVTLIEGCCRTAELKNFLQDRHLPLAVWLSEDATRITGRVQYDSGTNQLVGFVLPLADTECLIRFPLWPIQQKKYM